MLKVLIWQVSDDTSFKDKAIKILEQQHNGIEIVGEAVNENIAKVDGGGDCDLILVVGAKQIGMSKVTQDAARFNLPEKKLLGDWIVCIPGFMLEKYRRLQRSQLSILAVNCFGGIISNTLGLPFRSPLVNLYFGTGKDYIKFLSNLHVYMKETPIYQGQKFNSLKTFEFPIIKVGDSPINMMHYKSFEEAVEAWTKRKARINYYNLFVEMYTSQKKNLEDFDALPYGKKVCFVPFKSELDSAWYINPNIDKNARDFTDLVIRFARGQFFYYDWFDMLLYGKKTPLIDM